MTDTCSCRFSAADSAQRHIWAGRVRTSFRLPQNIARSWHGQSPIATRYPSPAPLAERSSEGAFSSYSATLQMSGRLYTPHHQNPMIANLPRQQQALQSRKMRFHLLSGTPFVCTSLKAAGLYRSLQRASRPVLCLSPAASGTAPAHAGEAAVQ